jgi:peptidoglycan hydrolase-like protein with peptidoglycan-binding domain
MRGQCRGLMAGIAIAASLATTLVGTSYAATDTSSSYLGVLNQERASRGIASLHMRTDLVRVAHSWVDEMARSGQLRHNPRLQSEVRNWWVVGENVGCSGDLPDLERAFWNSPDHRANILDPRYTDVGIATARSNGALWMAVVFRKPWHQAAPARQPRRSSRPSQQTWSGRLLMRGSVGPAVAFVQRLLGVASDGVFGGQTAHAVAVFQRRHHLVVDAVVGPITWSTLVRVRG